MSDPGRAEPAGRQVVVARARFAANERSHAFRRFAAVDRRRVAAVTLRTLEADGIVERKAYAEVPPRVEYRLTDRGRSLMPYLNGLVEWAQRHADGILENRK